MVCVIVAGIRYKQYHVQIQFGPPLHRMICTVRAHHPLLIEERRGGDGGRVKKAGKQVKRVILKVRNS
jgi:hypothetical protein